MTAPKQVFVSEFMKVVRDLTPEGESAKSSVVTLALIEMLEELCPPAAGLALPIEFLRNAAMMPNGELRKAFIESRMGP